MRFSLFGIAGVFSVCLLSTPVFANSAGLTGHSGKNGQTCNNCHTGGIAPSVEFSGPESLAAGATGQYSLIIRGGAAKMGGVNIAVDNAQAMLVQGTGLKRVGGELTHSAPKAFSENEVRFDFSLVAPPTAGTVNLFGAGNSTNGDGDITKDRSATAGLTVTVTGSAAGPDAGTGSPDAGTGDEPGDEDEPGGGCSSTGGAPVLLFVLAAAGATLLRRG
ncbi:hypothetical protein F0U60_16050 [Archangium minus]|uniref:Lipoprotein n=1 Tax=Archangium minus TaxID=83450 RepID=A0ABY9WNR5_9BACT|nr:hypothetical protein F0U60_16050 [Archangium minus]